MNPNTLRIVIALFLIAHAWIHVGLAQVPLPQPNGLRTPFFPSWWRDAVDTTWPVSKLGLAPQAARPLGWGLWMLVTVGYVAAGLALLLTPGQTVLWQSLAAGASGLSLLLLALYWHAWYPVGVLIDLGLLAAIYLRYPSFLFNN